MSAAIKYARELAALSTWSAITTGGLVVTIKALSWLVQALGVIHA